MPFPRVIPHSDAAGVIDSVGTGVEPSRVGQRVWVFGAQSYRPFGTAAELTVVPNLGRSGSPTTCPTRSVRASASPESPLTGPSSSTVRSTAPPCSCTACSAASGRSQGSSPRGAARRDRHGRADVPLVDPRSADHVVALDDHDPARDDPRTRTDGVDRVVEVDFSDNIDLDASVVQDRRSHRRVRHPAGAANAAVLADALRQRHRPTPRQRRPPRRCEAARRHGSHRRGGSRALSTHVDTSLQLEQTADAHDRVDAGTRRRLLVTVTP